MKSFGNILIGQTIAYNHNSMCNVKYVHKNKKIQDWKDDSVVKNTDCFTRGPGFDFQHVHDNS